MKKIKTLVLSFVMLLVLIIPAHAQNIQAYSNSNEEIAGTDQQELLSHTRKLNLQNVGDSQVLMVYENTILYIELVDKSESTSVMRAIPLKMSTATYDVKERPEWGIGPDKVVATISATSEWTVNGKNSRILSLTGTCAIKDNSFSAYWDQDPDKNISKPYFYSRVLDLHSGIYMHSYMITASMYFTDTAATVPAVDLVIGQFC